MVACQHIPHFGGKYRGPPQACGGRFAEAPPRLVGKDGGCLKDSDKKFEDKGPLSPRMAEILKLAAQGKTDKEIALHLHIGAETVSTHWKRLRAHFEAASRTEVVARVLASTYAEQFESLRDERELLLFEIAERERAERKLQELNDQLEAEVVRRTQWLANLITEYQQRIEEVEKRRDYLERVNSELYESPVVLFRNEYTGLFRQLFFSESVGRIMGYPAEDWMAGRISPLHCLPPEEASFVLKSVEAFASSESKYHLAPMSILSKEGKMQHTLNFLKVDDLDEKGQGTYLGAAVHLNPWLTQLRGLVASGWLDQLSE